MDSLVSCISATFLSQMHVCVHKLATAAVSAAAPSTLRDL